MRLDLAEDDGRLREFAADSQSTSSFSMAALVVFLVFITLAPLSNSATELFGAGGGSGVSEEGNLFRQLGYFLIYLLALMAVRIWQNPKELIEIPTAMLCTLAWFTASVLWAINPEIAARRLILSVMVISNIFLLVRLIGYGGSLNAMRSILAIILVVNYIAVLIWPNWAIHQEGMTGDENLGGTWRGVMMHKNNAGVACAYTIIIFVFDAARVKFLFRALIVALACFFLYKTNSKTSVGVLVFGMLMAFASLRYNPYYRIILLWSSVILVSILTVWIVSNQQSLTDYFSDGNSLTGRVQIWPALFEYWRENWILGSGFGSFWDIGELRPIERFVDRSGGWVVELASGHSGYLDILVQTGLPGLLLSILATVVMPLSKLMSDRRMRSDSRALILCCILFAAGHNFTESDFFQRDALTYVYLIFAIALTYLPENKQED